jgi:plasmid stability protein
MKCARIHSMTTAILQVRDVPKEIITKLRERAAAEHISLSTYVRNLLSYDAEQESMSEAITRITTRPPIQLDTAEILATIHEGRR